MQTQNMLERFYISFGLGTLQDSPVAARKHHCGGELSNMYVFYIALVLFDFFF